MHDRGKPPLPATDHDAARIADALPASPHIALASAAPGKDTVRLTSASDLHFTLTLREAAPTDDDILPARVLTGDPRDTDRATADLLHHMDATWNTQDEPLRSHAQTLARTLTRRGEI
ncbi:MULTISPECIES: hypothetical protein [unclassified Streptomyces]|uniref:hypothetical protein n=1 Tax=unclassified Streptomyces TaxID=2593676 RepID=UPI0038005196